MPFSDRVVLKVRKFFLVLSRGPPCGFNRTHLNSGLESPRPSLLQCHVGVVAFLLLDKQCSSLLPPLTDSAQTPALLPAQVDEGGLVNGLSR